MNWRHKIKMKQLFTTNEDPESVDKSMRAVRDVIKANPIFNGFDARNFYSCLEDDNPLGFANEALDELYDFADREKIWVD